MNGPSRDWRVRWLRWAGTAWTWVALAALVRFLCLALMPLQSNAMLDRAPPKVLARAKPVTGLSSAWTFLQRRTDYRPMTVDEAPYDEMARNIVAGRGFVLDSVFIVTSPGQPAMYAGCGYPFFVAGVYWLAGNGDQGLVFVLQVLLHAWGAWFVFQAAARLGGPMAGAAGAAFYAFHPVLIWSSVVLMSEAVLILPMAALGWLLTAREALTHGPLGRGLRATVIGLLLAWLCLTRSTCFGFLLVAALALLWEARKQPSWPGKVRPCFFMLIVFCVTCAPWTIRNYIHWGKFIPFSTKSGVNAWFFNHPGLKVEFSRRAVEGPQPIDIFDPRIQTLPDEAARDARLMEMFRQFVRENPGKFIGLCWMRFWMAVLPVRITSDTFTALATAWYSKGMVLALGVVLLFMAVARKFRWMRLAFRSWPLLLVVGYWQAIQTMAGPGMRYRLPADPAWAVLTGIGLALLLGWVFASSPAVSPLQRRWTRVACSSSGGRHEGLETEQERGHGRGSASVGLKD